MIFIYMLNPIRINSMNIDLLYVLTKNSQSLSESLKLYAIELSMPPKPKAKNNRFLFQLCMSKYSNNFSIFMPNITDRVNQLTCIQIKDINYLFYIYGLIPISSMLSLVWY